METLGFLSVSSVGRRLLRLCARHAWLVLLIATSSGVANSQVSQPTIKRAWGGRMLCSSYQVDSGSTGHIWVGEDGGRIRYASRASAAPQFHWTTPTSEQSAPSGDSGTLLGFNSHYT